MKFKKLTPNLVVSDVEASMKFYQTVFGFQTGFTVPDQPPYVFCSVVSGSGPEGGVEIFFNEKKAVEAEYPALVARPIGGTLTLYIEMKAGDLFYIAPGHDSWVVGDEPYVSLHFLGAEKYAQQKK